jgi:ribosome biogenesis GTPase / thiamine phosphate phosphatase
MPGSITPDRGDARPGDALRDFGYTDFFREAFELVALEGEEPARIIEERRGRYRVLMKARNASTAPGVAGTTEADAINSGKIGRGAASASEMPAVGDWAVLRPSSDGPATIRELLPRRTAFLRKAPGDVEHDKIDAQAIAANVDTAIIVVAAGRDWNPRRVERYVALSRAAAAESVLVITKADLAEDPSALLAEAERAAPGSRTAMLCAPEGLGVAEFAATLRPGETVVLLGSSGAGKSTLLNALAGRELARTGEVREDDQRGRHTTTHRQLYALPSGLLVIDTPGMRELQLWADEDAVSSVFPEIEALSEDCRFRDCRHEGEPGCAVLAALKSGLLDAGRYEGWKKLTKEAAFLRTKGDHSAKEAERRRWRSIERTRRSFAKNVDAQEKRR